MSWMPFISLVFDFPHYFIPIVLVLLELVHIVKVEKFDKSKLVIVPFNCIICNIQIVILFQRVNDILGLNFVVVGYFASSSSIVFDDYINSETGEASTSYLNFRILSLRLYQPQE